MRAVTDNSSNLTRARNVLSNRVAEAQEDDDDDAVVVGGFDLQLYQALARSLSFTELIANLTAPL